MRIARFDQCRLGIVEDDMVFDVTEAMEGLSSTTWPQSWGDHLARNLPAVMDRARVLRRTARAVQVAGIALNSPIAMPSKIMAAPANYRKHVEEDTKDPGVDQGLHREKFLNVEKPCYTYGLFLKASSSLVGPSEGVIAEWPGDRRIDHEVELAAVIGRVATAVPEADALSYVAGYSIGLDITVRGAEDRSFRKSRDSFAVLGPWLVTADSIPDAQALNFGLSVNGEVRQSSTTAAMTVSIAELVSFASRIYTLYPGDIIMTGTPEGVGPIEPGDTISAWCDEIGSMSLAVRGE